MPYREIEATLWGTIVEMHSEDGLTLRKATGAFGTLYEIECWSAWRMLRLPALLELLPPEARFKCIGIPDDDDPDESGVLTLQYWEDTKHRVHASTPGNRPQVRKPTDRL